MSVEFASIGESGRVGRWPTEIAFLARHGVPALILDSIAERAVRLGVSADRVAILEEHVAAEAFYRALAAELGVPFLAQPEAARPILSLPAAFEAGVVALAPGGRAFAFAPCGVTIGRLLAASAALKARIALTTPEALAGCIRAAAAPVIAARAALELPARRPEFSALTVLSRGQYAWTALLVLLLSFFGALEPLGTLFVSGLVLGPLFLTLATLRMAAAFEPAGDVGSLKRCLLADAQLPVYTVLVPLYREAGVVGQLVGALAALDYPKAKLDVKILLEAEDRETRVALAGRELPPWISLVIVPPGAPRTKPRALNAGLIEARGRLLAIFDAEDVPEPDQLRIAATVLHRAHPRLACVQARLAIDNSADSLLTRLFALEYAGLFDVINPGLVRSRLPFLIGGTSNHFRVDALREVGGWDAWNVTEDADLAVRLARAGYEIGDCPATTWEEAPVNIRGWMRQRRRWMKGFIQTAVTHSRQPLRTLAELGPIRMAALTSLCLGTVLSAMVYPIFLLAMLLAWRGGIAFASEDLAGAAILAVAFTLFAAGVFAIFVPPMLGAIRRRQWQLLLAVPLLPVYVLLVSLAAWRGFLDWVIAPHHWLKTEHGLARTSCRRGEPVANAGRATPSPLRPAADRG